MCRLGRTAAELLRSADRLDRTLARHQQMPVSFYGTVVQDEVDIPALETFWASRIATSPEATAPTGTIAAPPPPAAPQTAIAPDLADPPPDPESPPDQSSDPAPQPGQPRHLPARAPPAPIGSSNSSTRAPATPARSCAAAPPPTRCRSPLHDPSERRLPLPLRERVGVRGRVEGEGWGEGSSSKVLRHTRQRHFGEFQACPGEGRGPASTPCLRAARKQGLLAADERRWTQMFRAPATTVVK
jgi:hypothetical protein